MIDLLVNIDVPEIEPAAAFYRQAFGLTVGRRFGEGAIELLGVGAPIYLLAKPAGSAATPASADRRNYGRHWTPVHLDFVVADIDAALARAEPPAPASKDRPQSTNGAKLPFSPTRSATASA
jgi:hypothetical protein